MLPWLKPKPQTGLIVENRKPDGDLAESHSEGNEDAGLSQCAADLIRAVGAKDEAGVASALKAAFDILGSQTEDDTVPTRADTD